MSSFFDAAMKRVSSATASFDASRVISRFCTARKIFAFSGSARMLLVTRLTPLSVMPVACPACPKMRFP